MNWGKKRASFFLWNLLRFHRKKDALYNCRTCLRTITFYVTTDTLHTHFCNVIYPLWSIQPDRTYPVFPFLVRVRVTWGPWYRMKTNSSGFSGLSQQPGWKSGENSTLSNNLYSTHTRIKAVWRRMKISVCVCVCDRVCLCIKLWNSLTNEQKKSAVQESNCISLSLYLAISFRIKASLTTISSPMA